MPRVLTPSGLSGIVKHEAIPVKLRTKNTAGALDAQSAPGLYVRNAPAALTDIVKHGEGNNQAVPAQTRAIKKADFSRSAP